jgi:hypothetical protein
MTPPHAGKLRLAYVIVAHRLPLQLARLVRALDTGNPLFLIHVDRRTPDAVFRQVCDFLAASNAVMLRRYSSRHSGFGLVRASLEGIAYLAEHEIDHSHVIHLSGQDYPIKPPSQIHKRLAASPGRSCIECDPLPRAGWTHGGLDRFSRARFQLPGRPVDIPRRLLAPFVPRTLADELTPFGGSAFWALTAAHARYVHDYTSAHPELLEFFSRVPVADELFYQTVLANSPHAASLIPDNLHYVDWSPGTPAILRRTDLPQLQRSDALFARKFDVAVDASVLDQIDARLIGGGAAGAD